MKRRLTIPLLAFDGGGTKCVAVFIDAEGRFAGNGNAGSCNYQGVGRSAALQQMVAALRSAIHQLTDGASIEDMGIELECAVFGLAGVDTMSDRIVARGMVEEALGQLNIKSDALLVENDGFCALVGATDYKPGILVISGTGSIVYGIDGHGTSVRAGGWGHRIGDEGSGYWIGVQAIKAVLKAEDGRGDSTRLGEWIFPHLGISDAEDLFNWTYGSEYSVERVGQLAPLVDLAAIEADEVSRSILQAAAHELFIGSKSVIRKLQLQHAPFTIILQGGVLQHCDYIRNMLCQKLSEYSPLGQLDYARREPIYGVIAMGRSLLHAR